MKKILWVIIWLGIIVGFSNYSHAACSPDDSNYNDCMTRTYSNSSSSSSICDWMTDPKAKSSCYACRIQNGKWSDWNWWQCEKKYSCETLFVGDQKTADQCNFDRCQQLRWTTNASYCVCKYKDKWIPLNTNIPFIGNCIQKNNADWSSAASSAFPTIIGAVSRIIVTLILLSGTIMIIVWWIRWAGGDAWEWKKMITKVATWFALLGAMWAILRFINPNFFK